MKATPEHLQYPCFALPALPEYGTEVDRKNHIAVTVAVQVTA
jgi:hypothetical protein